MIVRPSYVFLRDVLRFLLSAILLYCPLAIGAVERISVCFNYGCLAQAEVEYDDRQLREVGLLFRQVATPADEREAIGEAVGRLLDWAGRQSPIGADRGGNYADDGVYGRMDCIDHSTTTTRLLHLIDAHGWLRFHRVLEPALRWRFLLFQHYSAQIEERGAEGAGKRPERFVVDSWFFDNGHPAAVMPLAAWMAGEGPDGHY